MKRFFCTLVLLAPALLFAESPFDGTWITKLDTAQLPAKPEKYLLKDGTYDCLTCVPKYSVKADGTDQKVTGHPYYDTVAAHVVNGSTLEIIEKKDGKTIYIGTDSVSEDGSTLTSKFTNTSGAKAITGDVTSTRVAKGPAGSHAISGSWRISKINSVSDNGLTVTYQTTADGLKMDDHNGGSFDAKFDGKDYPVLGDPGHTMVSLKRISTNTIEEIDKHDDKVIGISHMTVSPDGKTIQAEYADKERGTTTKWTMEKR